MSTLGLRSSHQPSAVYTSPYAPACPARAPGRPAEAMADSEPGASLPTADNFPDPGKHAIPSHLTKSFQGIMSALKLQQEWSAILKLHWVAGPLPPVPCAPMGEAQGGGAWPKAVWHENPWDPPGWPLQESSGAPGNRRLRGSAGPQGPIPRPSSRLHTPRSEQMFFPHIAAPLWDSSPHTGPPHAQAGAHIAGGACPRPQLTGIYSRL